MAYVLHHPSTILAAAGTRSVDYLEQIMQAATPSYLTTSSRGWKNQRSHILPSC